VPVAAPGMLRFVLYTAVPLPLVAVRFSFMLPAMLPPVTTTDAEPPYPSPTPVHAFVFSAFVVPPLIVILPPFPSRPVPTLAASVPPLAVIYPPLIFTVELFFSLSPLPMPAPSFAPVALTLPPVTVTFALPSSPPPMPAP